jgi:hypothetical protein
MSKEEASKKNIRTGYKANRNCSLANGWLKMYSDDGPDFFEKALVEGEQSFKGIFATSIGDFASQELIRNQVLTKTHGRPRVEWRLQKRLPRVLSLGLAPIDAVMEVVCLIVL